jgi:hypothetical protein
MEKQTIVELLFSQGVMAVWLPFLFLAFCALGRLIWKDKVAFTDERRSQFIQGVDLAYNVVNNVAAMSENKIDDKVAEGLKVLSAWLKRDLKPAEVADAKLMFDAMHGAELKFKPVAGKLVTAGEQGAGE